jgi:hypothetical protein
LTDSARRPRLNEGAPLGVLPVVVPALGRDVIEEVVDVGERSKGQQPRVADLDRLAERSIPVRPFRHSIFNPRL